MFRFKTVAVALVLLGAPVASRSQTLVAATTGAGLTTLSLPAVAYGSRPGSTRIAFKGTSLMPGASGQATVEKQSGAVKIVAQFTNLQNPTSFGHEYLTYVVWALAPDGRAFNIGELVLPEDRNAWTSQTTGNRSSVTITTPHQTFAMVVTAEPYYAVRLPSRVVVLENTFAAGAAPLQKIDTTYDLARAGGYVPTGFTFDSVLLRTNLPLDFFQARNALRIAQAAGAEQHAATIYTSAVNQLKRAEELAGLRRTDKRSLTIAAREAVQSAEDAREIAAKGAEAKRQDDERRAAVAREAEARALAQADLERKLRAEADRAAAAEAQRAVAHAEQLAAERRREEADRASREAQAAAKEALHARAEAEERRAPRSGPRRKRSSGRRRRCSNSRPPKRRPRATAPRLWSSIRSFSRRSAIARTSGRHCFSSSM